MSTPLVSIHCNVFNARDTVTEALSSTLHHAPVDVEAVVADDGSTDGTLEILQGLAREDPRIHVLALPHEGIVAAQRAALERCRAPYILHMDADDVSLPGRISAQLAALESDSSLSMVSCQVEMFRRGGELGSGIQRWGHWVNGLLTPEDIARERFVDSPVPHSTALFRAEALRSAGAYRDPGWSEDYDLWLRLLDGGARIGRVARVLVRIGDRPDRVLRTHPSCSEDALRRCKLHYLKRGLLAGRTRVDLWGAGEVGKRWLKALPQAGIEVSLLVDLNPRKVGRRIHGAEVVWPSALLGSDSPALLVAVGKPGAREDIRQRLAALGRREAVDYVFVA